MYLCFEEDDKRMAFPEQSLLSIDENGYTLKGMAPGKAVRDMIFLKFTSFKGCTQTFQEAQGWIRKKPRPPQVEIEITNSAGNVVAEFTTNGNWTEPAQPRPQQPQAAAPQPGAPAQRPAAPAQPGQPGQPQRPPQAPQAQPGQPGQPQRPQGLPEAPKF